MTNLKNNYFVKVESSNISAVGYANDSLFVQYKNGSMYLYNKVPKKVYEELLKAESKGRFVNESIKGKYEYNKVAVEL